MAGNNSIVLILILVDVLMKISKQLCVWLLKLGICLARERLFKRFIDNGVWHLKQFCNTKSEGLTCMKLYDSHKKILDWGKVWATHSATYHKFQGTDGSAKIITGIRTLNNYKL